MPCFKKSIVALRLRCAALVIVCLSFAHGAKAQETFIYSVTEGTSYRIHRNDDLVPVFVCPSNCWVHGFDPIKKGPVPARRQRRYCGQHGQRASVADAALRRGGAAIPDPSHIDFYAYTGLATIQHFGYQGSTEFGWQAAVDACSISGDRPSSLSFDADDGALYWVQSSTAQLYRVALPLSGACTQHPIGTLPSPASLRVEVDAQWHRLFFVETAIEANYLSYFNIAPDGPFRLHPLPERLQEVWLARVDPTASDEVAIYGITADKKLYRIEWRREGGILYTILTPLYQGRIIEGFALIELCSMDTDGDAIVDCADDCPGEGETDTDGDGTPDCNDGCPVNAPKTAPGVCGCATPDIDTDADGRPDCTDGCPLDPAKTAGGICGCGTPDTDDDADGTPNCTDGCPSNTPKIAPGICGCGTPDTDTDADGTLDCIDGCPSNAPKITPGICGCGTPDSDTDGDGTLDCDDGCPSNAAKITPGICGCGTPDTDTDRDSTVDCRDACPLDPAKAAVGLCGCGVADTDEDCSKSEQSQSDSDGDGTPDAVDGCPQNFSRIYPDENNSCGDPNDADRDSDQDGTPDAWDDCPNNPDKQIASPHEPCGNRDDPGDRDGDGVPDGRDECPSDGAKSEYGACGCSRADTDGNRNGVPDCFDAAVGTEDDVTPSTVLIRPYLRLNADNRQLEILLQIFDEASLGALPGLRAFAAAAKRSNKKLGKDYSYRYRVLIQQRDSKVRRKVQVTKRNRVTLRKLKNGDYSVRYRVEIVQRNKVVAQTSYSPASNLRFQR